MVRLASDLYTPSRIISSNTDRIWDAVKIFACSGIHLNCTQQLIISTAMQTFGAAILKGIDLLCFTKESGLSFLS